MPRLWKLGGLAAAAISLLAGLAAAGEKDLASYRRPLLIPFTAQTPYSPQLATLGKMLFFDPRLSGAENMTCASCHNPSFGFETPVPLAVGAANTHLGRHAPTVLNMAWVSPLFLDGRAPTLEAQAAGPITAPAEMNGHFDEVVARLRKVSDYKAWFDEVFPGKGITQETMLTAIATFERTIVSGWSPFDRWVDGDASAVSASAQRGFALFTGAAGCSGCHSGWNFTDNKFHDIGLPGDDVGRAKYEPGNVKAMHAFKTPGLRNTAYRAPFMHDGSLPDLGAVIDHYEAGGEVRDSLASQMLPFALTRDERADLIAFLGALTAEKQDIPLPTLPN